jgi:ubiquinone/menaquinone biosynthesis C-methylase UbiE
MGRGRVSVAKGLIQMGQAIPAFRARGSYSSRVPGAVGSDCFPESEAEFSDQVGFLQNYYDSPVPLLESIRGRRVLDHGSGWGGRTAWLAGSCEEVHGVEIYENMVAASSAFARHRGLANCHFQLGKQEAIEFPDDHFDVVISNDVLEHVHDPERTLVEFRRVLKPEGLAFVVFTPYWGMFCHHLNYITMLPGLHWLFSAETLGAAVNELLESPSHLDLDVALQPAPQLSFNGSRTVLPTLNGLSGRDYEGLVRKVGLIPEFCRTTPILERFPAAGVFGGWINRALCAVRVLAEPLGHNLVSVLRKP